MLEMGEGLRRDSRAAVACYARAAYIHGLADAQKDEAAAVRLYMQAAELGHRGAQFTIGFYFERGMGLRRSRSNAVRWYRAAAEQGDALAQQALQRLGVAWG